LEDRDAVKGEITVVVEGAEPAEEMPDAEELAEVVRNASCSASELARELAQKHNLPRRKIYEEILKIKKGAG
ncbi:MAG: rRNA (cytidine-2'-O-)-methyltransferase, partial [Thermodesulfobacteriota bacterium]